MPENSKSACADFVTDVVLIYATFPSVAEAERIGGELVERRLAACVNILPGMVSIYRWEGRLNRDQEAAMIIKTRASLIDQAIAEAKAMHPYSNPAFVVVPAVGGSAAFLDWIRQETAAT